MLETCLDQLRRQGFRPTPLRRALLRLLHEARAPLSAPEIERRFKDQQMCLNKTTVYRTLELFERLGLVTRTVVNERTQYYELSEHGHHHHFICTKCDAMRDIPLSEVAVLRDAERLGKRFGFTILNHMLEFYGLCSGCTSRHVKISAN